MIIIFLLLSLFISYFSDAHVFRIGDCPRIDVQKNFDIEKYLGRWYIIQKFRTSSNCMTEMITKDNNGSYYVFEQLSPLGIEISQKGKIEFLENMEKAMMRIDFPITSPLGPQNYWVIMTDYDNYAAVWSCQRLMFGHRQSAQIMSRLPKLDIEIIRKIRKRIESYGINEHEFSFIDQTNCNRETERYETSESITCSTCKPNFSMKLGPINIST